MAEQGTGVLDADTGNQVYFPDKSDGSPATTTDIQTAMKNINNGTTEQPPKSWVQQHIIDPVTQFAGKYNLDPVMSVKAFGGGFFKGEGFGQLLGGIKYPQQDPNNVAPLAPPINEIPRVPTPTVPEQMMYREKAPFSYLAGQFAGFGTDFALASVATGGAIDALAPMALKVPAFANLLKGIEDFKQAGILSEQGVETGAAVLKTPLTWGTTGLAGSVASQKQETGNIDWGKAIKDMGDATGLGITAELTFGFVSKPLSEIGTTSDLIANTSRKMVVAGALAAGIVKANGGTNQESAFAAALGAFGGAMTLHGDIEGVRQSVMKELIDMKARYTGFETGEHPTSAYQKSMEHTLNDAEEVINEENKKLMEAKPVPEEQRMAITQPISDPVDARNHLVQFFSPHILARMDDEYVTWLANQPIKQLNAWAEQGKEVDWEKAIEENRQRAMSEVEYDRRVEKGLVNEDDAKRARGIPVGKTAIDVVVASKERTTNLVTKTLNEVTGEAKQEGEQIGERNPKEPINTGEQNAEKSRGQVATGSGEEASKGQAGERLYLRNNGQEGTNEGGEKGISKASGNINKQFAKQGVETIPEEELAKYDKQKRSDLEDKVLGILSDPERLDKVLSGEETLSDNEAMAVASGAEKMGDANGDNDLLRKVATSPILTRASQIGQALASRKAFGYEAKDGKVSGVQEARKANEDLKKEVTPEKQEKIKKTFTQIREKARKLQKEEMIKNIKKSLDDVLNKAAC